MMVRNQAEDFVRGVLGMLEEDKAEIYKNYEQDELESVGVKIKQYHGTSIDGDVFAGFEPDEVDVWVEKDDVIVVLRWTYNDADARDEDGGSSE